MRLGNAGYGTNDGVVVGNSSINQTSRHGVGTFRAKYAWADPEHVSTCSLPAQPEQSVRRVSIAVSDVLANMSTEAQEALAAGRGSRRVTGFPRCNCEGDAKIAARWRKQAEADTGKFIEEMYGTPPEQLDSSDRRAMKRDCAPFLPKKKLEMLVTLTSKPPRTFWAEFSGKLSPASKKAGSAPLSDAESLALIKARFPRLRGVKKVEDVELTPQERYQVRNDTKMSSRLSDDALIAFGIVRGGRKTKSKELSPAMTLVEAESYVLRTFKDAKRDTASGSGRLFFSGPNARKRWVYLRDHYGVRFPQSFLDEYADEFEIKKAGRKRSNGARKAVKVTTVDPKSSKKTAAPGVVKPPPSRADQQKSKLKRRDKKLRDSGIDPAEKKARDREIAKKTKKPTLDPFKALLHDDGTDDTQSTKIVPDAIITDPDRLRRRVNNMSQQIDNKFLFGTPFEKYTGLQWTLMDSIRTSISPELLKRFKPQMDAARLKRNQATGGAYSSLVSNSQLAVAHITTAWFCGEL